MILKNDELVHEFYTKFGGEFPELDLNQFKEIVYTPWRYLRKEMESGDLTSVRLKYFGSFQVYDGRARRMLVDVRKRYKEGKLEEKQFLRIEKMLAKHVAKLDENEKHL